MKGYKTFVVVLIAMFVVLRIANGVDLQHLNPDVLGRNITSPIVLFSNTPSAVVPSSVQLDVKNSQISAVTVRYPDTISFEDAKQSLGRRYERWRRSDAGGKNIASWRVEEEHFAIRLLVDNGEVAVLYFWIKK